jgi:hypothetical protein
MSSDNQTKKGADSEKDAVSEEHDVQNTKTKHKMDQEPDWKSVVRKRKTDVPEVRLQLLAIAEIHGIGTNPAGIVPNHLEISEE